MKTRRIASSIAVAVALAFGATGCSLFAAQGTMEPYAPSDGVDVTIKDIAVRNLLLIADASGENFNVVFTGVNNTSTDAIVRMTFVTGSTEASTDFALAPGLSSFGNPDGEFTPQLVSLPGLKPGETVEAYFEVPGGGEAKYEVPVLDGTLEEYKNYVISKSQMRVIEDAEKKGDKDSDDKDPAKAGESAAKAEDPVTEDVPAAE